MLAGVLAKCREVAHLNLGSNDIGADGEGMLAEVLAKFRSTGSFFISATIRLVIMLRMMWCLFKEFKNLRKGSSVELLFRFH
jgi:hypothetical protein